MMANRGRNTTPELSLRRRLHALGLRYYVNRRPVRTVARTADIVFPRSKVAVFVDGCYWHCCPIHGTRPRTNADFWSAKLDRNANRDLETNQALIDAGWTVVRIWEHDDPDAAASLVRSVISHRTTANAAVVRL
jgi:DNA mismatch endonuclease (patch repair protein)